MDQSNLAKGDIARLVSYHVMSWPPYWLSSKRIYSAIRSADPENPPQELNMKWIESPIEISPFEIRHMMKGTFGTAILGKRGRRESAIVPFERAMVVSYRLSIVTLALFRTIWPFRDVGVFIERAPQTN